MKKRLKHRYKTSTDYERLYDLAQSQRIVCFVDYMTHRDVAQTQAIRREGDEVDVAARGISYVQGYQFEENTAKETFIEGCKSSNLEFIFPTEVSIEALREEDFERIVEKDAHTELLYENGFANIEELLDCVEKDISEEMFIKFKKALISKIKNI